MVIILILLVLFFVRYKPFKPSEIYPITPEEKQMVEEWIETKPAVITEEGEEKRAIAAEWLTAIRQYLLRDEKGQEIGYVKKEVLIGSIKIKTKPQIRYTPQGAMQVPVPAAHPGPAPAPVTVPIPTPPPVTMPTPTPTPPVPTPTPPAPVPTPPPLPPPPPGPVCGNGLVEAGEQCDDGNTISGDGCSAGCQIEYCGDGIIQAGLGEQCDPPDGITCDKNCQTIITSPYPAHCTNLQSDGDESDWNCGGSCLPCPPQPPYCDDINFPSPWGVPCAQHLSCWNNADCASGNCDMSQAKSLPAISPTGAVYNTTQQLRMLKQRWAIPWQGKCV